MSEAAARANAARRAAGLEPARVVYEFPPRVRNVVSRERVVASRGGRSSTGSGSTPAARRRAARRACSTGQERVIKHRFNVSVPRARVPNEAFTLRERSER